MAGVTVSPARSPAPVSIRQADPIRDLAVVRDLWNDYLVWVNAGLEEHYGFSFDIGEILERNVADLAPFQPPHGRLLLADDVGVGCLRSIGDDVGEIKRMYVRPEARGTGLGRSLLGALLEAADTAGYERVRLDSVRFMEAAHKLYRSAGFKEIEPYEHSEIPPEFWDYWVFMERVPY
jgi:GNAT superfamily N-acetyltransferase